MPGHEYCGLVKGIHVFPAQVGYMISKMHSNIRKQLGNLFPAIGKDILPERLLQCWGSLTDRGEEARPGYCFLSYSCKKDFIAERWDWAVAQIGKMFLKSPDFCNYTLRFG